MLASSTEESEVRDPWVTRMRNMPATVVSTTLEGPLDWPDATLVSGDAVDVVARLKAESEVPLRSHGSLSMNWALMAAGLVDRVQVTIFPVITGRPVDPIFEGAADFDLELLESRTLDGHTQELVYRPTLHRDASAVVVDDLDVVPVGVQDERAVVARVVDGALAGTAVVLVARGERGGVERPHGRVVLRREREVDCSVSGRSSSISEKLKSSPTIWTRSGSSTPIRSPACGAIVV